MSETTQRLLEAAAALSAVLRASGVRHAFYGSVFTAVLSNSPTSDEICCIVDGGPVHPFRRVRDALAGNEDIIAVHSPWSNRLHASYRRVIPAIEIEILRAGEEGPRRLDATTVVKLHGVPFLNISEFVRAKIKFWSMRGTEHDAQDIIFALNQFWNTIDINRIPESDMHTFVVRHRAAAPAWSALRRKYGM
ncbi:hypothetical protein PLICRDRAFT_51489 [Plicaturopsis crispa FD-325 SS-3]|nr:hypothetical protein PLICRDRAFT_51489 [Plicaturopsis crispa FD-325 SS-3]